MTKEKIEKFEKEIEEKSKKIAEKTAKEIASEGLIFEAEINRIKCTKCGHLNDRENKFCGNCGVELREK